MPTYHYRCKSCHHEFEELQKIADDPLVVCPSCNRHSLVRILSGGAGFVFKGSGFYITDYKNKPNSAHPKESAKEVKSGTKTEHKSPESSKPVSDSPKKD